MNASPWANTAMAQVARALELAERYRSVGSHDSALDQAQIALGQDPENTAALAMRARCLLDLNRLNEAEQAAFDLLAQAPEDFDGHYVRHRVFSARGHMNEARDELNEMLRIDPENVAALLIKANMLLDLDARPGLLAEAGQAAERAVQLAPDLALTHSTRARHQLATGAFIGAQDSVQTALELDPEDVLTNLLAAELALIVGGDDAQGRFEDSVAVVLRDDPDNDSALRLVMLAQARKNPLLKPLFAVLNWAQKRDQVWLQGFSVALVLIPIMLIGMFRDVLGPEAIMPWAIGWLSLVGYTFGGFAYLQLRARAVARISPSR